MPIRRRHPLKRDPKDPNKKDPTLENYPHAFAATGLLEEQLAFGADDERNGPKREPGWGNKKTPRKHPCSSKHPSDTLPGPPHSARVA